MSTILLTNITIADPQSPHNGTKTNIFILDGKIDSIVNEIQQADQVIDAAGYFVSPGWIDSLAFCGEPGEEWKEDILSLSQAGEAGGFTRIAAYCGVHPFPDNASAISNIKEKGKDLVAKVLPIGSLTLESAGNEMAELFDMQRSGAVAFFDGDNSINQNGLKSRLLEYANNFDAPVYMFPFDKSLAIGGSMHEGEISTSLGLKGIPTISEVSALQSDIELASWLNTPLRAVRISSAESVQLLRDAKERGMEVIASVPVLNLLFTDADLLSFDENYKVLPPLRTTADRDALIQGLMDGTIDAVCSNHVPQDSESKDVEFDYSAYGASSIQTAFSALLKALGNNANAAGIADLLAYGPAKLLGLTLNPIDVGNAADLTVFSIQNSWTFDNSTNKSKSRNNPLLGQSLNGTILGVVSNGEFHWNTAQNAALPV